MKIKVSFEFEVSDLPNDYRKEIADGIGEPLSELPTLSDYTEEEVKSEISTAMSSFFEDLETQTEMWAGSDFYLYISGCRVLPDA